IITFGIFFFFIALSVEGITPIDDVINEHRLYLASLGFILTMQFIVFKLLMIFKLKTHFETIWIMFIAVWVMILSFLTYQRNFVWQSQSTLWHDTVKKSPAKPLAHYNLGVVYHYQGDAKAALDEFQIAVNLNDNYADAYENLGSEFMNLGEVESAKKAYLKNLNLNPNNTSVKLKLLDVYAQEKNWPQIEKAYQDSIIKYEVPLPLQKDSKGVLFLKQNKINEARLEFEDALKEDPDFIDARYNLATTLYRQNKTIQSIEQYQLILKRDKNQPQVFTDLGVIYLEQGNLIGAKNMLKSAFDLDQNNGVTLFFLGLTEYKMGLIKEALNYLTQAYVVNPDSYQSLELLGDIYSSQGKLKKSLFFLKKAQVLNKDSDTITPKIIRIEKLIL
ncbi:tetratricopeptide repeat protein, partial [Candidatus Gottesmanbacteria bacterium]|nr:tetratricopeptide repeat protein [Candidatus Gottesmanbacteria bacterium]